MQPNDDTQHQNIASQQRLAAERSPGDAIDSPPHPRAAQPQRIGKYEVEELLGTGAFGRVFKCYDSKLDRHVAIKVLRDEILVPGARERLVQDFLNEARAVAKVKHHFVCEIYEVGHDADRPFIVMPFVESGTLLNWMAANPLPPPPVALALVRDVAVALDFAHRRGIIHRDVKPANVLWDKDAQRVLVTDFGLAKLIDATLTVSVARGTPLYMSPEQWRPAGPHKVGPASDVYSLGVVLFQLLTGVLPFGSPAGDPIAFGMTVCTDPPRVPSDLLPHLDPRLDAVCLKALAKVPADRYPSAKAFADALDECRRALEEAELRARTKTDRGTRAEADLLRGEVFYHGRGTARDHAKARELFERAAAQNNARALNYLGYMYQYALGVEQDYMKAREFYEKAAAQGNAAAQNNLAVMYQDALGVERDYTRARELYEKAAAQGHTFALCNLGSMYRRALGVTLDYTKARELYEKAAAMDNALAQNYLGYMYQNALGVAQDHAKARELFEKAIAHGDAAAHNNLAYMYQNALGVERDYARARELYEKAAAQGEKRAQYHLGTLYESGLGVPPDRAKARELYELAAAQGDEDARKALERINGTQ